MKEIPLRSCACCRERKPKKEMLRVVKNSAGEIFVDKSGKANGRGAYICGEAECIKKMRKTRALNRAFSCEVPDAVYAAIEEEFGGK